MCDDFIRDELTKAIPCKCKMAVLNTYEQLLAKNNPASFAVEAAYHVYRFHHPEQSKADSRLIVERWVTADRVH